jgi:phage shock protein E
MMRIFEKNKWMLAGSILGGILGYLYYHFIGCQSGSCAITSQPVNSTLYGLVMGGLFFSLFSKDENG